MQIQAIEIVEVPGYGGGFASVLTGQYVQITDIAGGQIGDMFAISSSDHHEYLSPSVTRLHNLNLFPRPGEFFYSNKDHEMFKFVADRSPGCHDMLMASCHGKMFEDLGVENHPNCRDNYFKAAAEAGIKHTIKPDPVNFFQNTPVTPDGSISAYLTKSQPGDNVVLQARMDLFLILTACSTEMINHGKSSPLLIEIFSESPVRHDPS